tara:strand:+ start:217 stop:831 length:615 start_codon:yes stop_codon:yes gene_type:complete
LRTLTLVSAVLFRTLFAQECLIDGKNMYSIGSSEIVNGELLGLFRCDDGHQMWLSNYDEENTKKNNLEKEIVESQSEPAVVSSTISLVASVVESTENVPIYESESISIPITKKETVLKIGSASANYTSDVSIKKFGVETLLHKKIESDRVFAEAVEEEKNELLYIMDTQKRLFEMAEENKFRLFQNPIKSLVYISLSLILITYL